MHAEKHVVIDKSVALIAPVEGADEVGFRAGIDIVRPDQPQHLAKPGHRLHQHGRAHHAVTDTLDPGGPGMDAHQLAGPVVGFRAGVEFLVGHRN